MARRGRVVVEDSSDNEDFMPPPAATTRPTRRLAGGGARGAPAPASARNAPSAQRGRPTATRGARRGATAAAAARGARGVAAAPIVGGRQSQMVSRATRVRAAVGSTNRGNGRAAVVAAFGHAYRTGGGRADTSAGDTSVGTIDLDDGESDEESEGDDVNRESTDEDDEEEEMGHDDSLRAFIDDDAEEGDFFNLFNLPDDSFAMPGEEETDEENAQNETFGQEVAEFELMEERESAASRKREERLRKKEDKEEQENKNVLRTDMFGPCTVCAEDEVVDPIGCLHCSNFIGCRKCSIRWYRTSQQNDENKTASCPLCRHEWPSSVPEVGDMLDLVKTT